MEPKASFVWAQSRVELNPVSTVDLDFSFVVLPDHAELDDSLRDSSNLQGSLVFWVLLE